MSVLYGVLVAWLIGTLGSAWAIRYAHKRALLDRPGERRSHSSPTPRGGGIAIVVAVLAVGAGLWVLKGLGANAADAVLPPFLLGFTLVAAVGWADDHRPLPAAGRLCVHIVAAGVFAAAVAQMAHHPGWGLLAFAAPLALTNVWNFMDGINGLAATQALVVAVVFSLGLEGIWAALAVALAASIWAFVPYNFPNAKVFMGDVGSGALGFALGALLVLVAWQATHASATPAALALTALPVSAFLLDAALTLGRRILRRERWWAPHVQHAYQCAARQVGHGRVTMGFLGWTLLSCGLALLLRSQSEFFVIASVLGWYTLGAALWARLQRQESGRNSVVRSRNGA